MPRSFLSFLAALALLAGLAPGRGAEAQPMVIATGVDPGFAHFYVATRAGILKKHGIDAELKTGPSGGAMIPLLISNQSNASMSAALAGLNNHLTDANVVAVAQIVTYDRWYGIVSLKEIAKVEDLKGRKIGITPGTASESLWAEILKHYKLDPAEYNKGIVKVEAPEMLAAIERGDIHAFSNWEPWLSRTVLALPKTHVLRDNYGILQDLGYIYMNRGWIEKNRETAVKFMRAMVETADFINGKPEETRKIVGQVLNLSPELMNAMMPKLSFYTKLDQQTVDLTRVHIDQLTARGRITGKFDYNKWFYPDLLRAADASRVNLPAQM